jgi:hypothetical protein
MMYLVLAIRLLMTVILSFLSVLIAYALSPMLIYLPAKQFHFYSFWIVLPLLATLSGVAVWRSPGKLNYTIAGFFAITTVSLFFLGSHMQLCTSIGNIALVHAECYYQTNPLIDTVLPKEFSEDKFAVVKPGMSDSEVMQLLGSPALIQDEMLVYGSDGAVGWWDFAWVQYTIHLNAQGKVVDKEREIFYN